MKKSLSLALSVLLLHALSFAPVAADTPFERSRKSLLASEVKAGVAHLGTGRLAGVRVVLHDRTKYHGYVTEIGEDAFVVADAKTGATAPIQYGEVKGIKGNNFSTGAKIGIGVAIAAAVAVIAAVLARDDDDVRADEPSCTRTTQVGVPCPPGCVCIQG